MAIVDRKKYLNNDKIIDAIIQGAQESIYILTGKNILLNYKEAKVGPKHEVHEMLLIIAESLSLDARSYAMGKKRVFVDLRCIAAVMIRRMYPQLNMDQMAEVLGLSSHKPIPRYLKSCQNYIETEDRVFMLKYERALNAVELWESKKHMICHKRQK